MITVHHIDIVNNTAARLMEKGCQFKSNEELCRNIARNNQKICHIIGSGWSLNHTISSISENAYIMGFNSAAQADLSFPGKSTGYPAPSPQIRT